MSYRFLDHTADIAVEITAETLEDLFLSAASAWKESILEAETECRNTKKIYLTESTLEEMLVGFLDELNYLLLTKRWIPEKFSSIKIKGKDGNWDLQCAISGDDFDSNKHILKEEIKAVTFHQMDIRKKGDLFHTRIVFDI